MNEDANALTAAENIVVTRVLEILEGGRPENLTDDERQGMRAFLQRAETRLSTYQRVGGVFLNGAGLLVLLPTLARESLFSMLRMAFEGSWTTRIVLIPWAFTIGIPLYAFFLLLKDLVHFYFSPRFLELDPIRITRFALAGVTLPYDEGSEAKAQVIATKITGSHADFMMGGTSPRAVEQVYDRSRGGKAVYPLRLAIIRARQTPRTGTDLSNEERIGVALSLAGSLDLSLVGEVARMEASVARHVLLLRKLVLRYMKVLLLFLWTTLVSLAIVGVVADNATLPTARVVAALIVYAVWAGTAIALVRRPLQWVNQLTVQPSGGADGGTGETFQDPDLQVFETVVTRLLLFVVLGSIAAAAWVLATR